jgi:hypothetical protein
MRRLLGIATIAAVALAGCGGSSNHSSEWTPQAVTALENKLKEELDGAGALSKYNLADVGPHIIACVVERVKPLYSPKEALAFGETNTPAKGREIGTTCAKKYQPEIEAAAKKLNEGSALGTATNGTESEGQATTPGTETGTSESSPPVGTTPSSEAPVQPYGAWDAEKTKGLELLLEAYSNRSCIIRYVEEHESPPGSSLKAEELAKQGAPSCGSVVHEG